MRLSVVVVVVVPVAVVSVRVSGRLIADFERRWPPTEPPLPKGSRSPFEEPGRAPKRFREMTSRPKMCAFERRLDGVAGLEGLFVWNLNNPY